MSELFDLGFSPAGGGLPFVANTIRGAQVDLGQIDQAALRLPQESLVAATLNLQQIDDRLLKRPLSVLNRAQANLDSVDQAILQPTLIALERARTELPPPVILEPGLCQYCYLVMRTPATDLSGRTVIFPLTNLIDQSGPIPDRIYAVCYQDQHPIDFARLHAGYIFYSWQPISVATYNNYRNTYPGGVPGIEGELLRQALGDYCEPGRVTYQPGRA